MKTHKNWYHSVDLYVSGWWRNPGIIDEVGDTRKLISQVWYIYMCVCCCFFCLTEISCYNCWWWDGKICRLCSSVVGNVMYAFACHKIKADVICYIKRAFVLLKTGHWLGHCISVDWYLFKMNEEVWGHKTK